MFNPPRDSKEEEDSKEEQSTYDLPTLIERINNLFNHSFQLVLADMVSIAQAYTARREHHPFADTAINQLTQLTEIIRTLNNQSGGTETNIRAAITVFQAIIENVRRQTANVPLPPNVNQWADVLDMDPDEAGINFHWANLHLSIADPENPEENLNTLINNLEADVNRHFSSATTPQFGR